MHLETVPSHIVEPKSQKWFYSKLYNTCIIIIIIIILSLYHSEIIYWYCLLLEIIELQNGWYVQYTGLDS